MTDVVLGVDSSTQSCTVELREVQTGRLVSTARAAHPPTNPPVSEQHPDEWWNALVIATRQAVEAAGESVTVVGVGVGAQCHGLVVSDASGAVIRPAKLWNDTTSGPQARALVEKYGVEWWAKEIGVVPSAALTISKLLWLKETEPENFARIAHIQVPHDWITYRLTGRYVTDRSDASGTGYYSAATGTWRTDILNATVGERDWSSVLPEVLAPEGTAGVVTDEAAAALGITAGGLVSAGGGDQHLAAQGIGLRPGDVAYSLGTSGVVFATTVNSIHDVTGAVDGVANVTGGYLPLVCSLNAAKVTDAAARLLGVDHGTLSDLALAAPITADRPVMAAFLDGERSPRMPWARGMLAGLTSDITREQLALSAFEGVVLGLATGERRIAEFGLELTGRAIVVGGGAKSQAYRQIVADLSHRETHTVDAPEGTARGAAIQAAAVVRGETVAALTGDWAPETTSVTLPRDDRAAGLMERYSRLVEVQADGKTY